MSSVIKMIYKPSEDSKAVNVDVYNIAHTVNSDGEMLNTVCTAWAPKIKQWIVAPLWCFIPVENKCKKLLKETS